MLKFKKISLACIPFLMISSVQAGSTLNAIQTRGHLLCGVNTAAPGFSGVDSKGKWQGLDVDFCRAVAAAVLGDAQKVKFVPLSSPQRFTALQSGEIDILARNTTWNMTRDVTQGALFAAISYYDGQAVMVPAKYNIKSVKQLNGATVCIQAGTSSEKTLAEYFSRHNIKYKTVVFDTTEATQGAFLSGRCQAYTTDKSDLAGIRLQAQNPKDFVILPETLSKEPLGPAVRRGDDDFFQIVRWSFAALIESEEYGITKLNASNLRKTTTNPNIKRLLGTGDNMGKMLGLDKEWSYRIITQVGNYGESWNRNFGPKTPLNLDRGLNNLWTKGGLMYGLPIR